MTSDEKVVAVLGIVFRHSVGGEHHKAWVIDQIVRILTGDNYKAWVAKYRMGEDGIDTYGWDEGIAP